SQYVCPWKRRSKTRTGGACVATIAGSWAVFSRCRRSAAKNRGEARTGSKQSCRASGAVTQAGRNQAPRNTHGACRGIGDGARHPQVTAVDRSISGLFSVTFGAVPAEVPFEERHNCRYYL